MLALALPVLLLWLLDTSPGRGWREGSGRMDRDEFERVSSGIRPIDYQVYEQAMLDRAAKRRSDSVRVVLSGLLCILKITTRPTFVVLMAAFTMFSTDLILGHAESLGRTGLICLQAINLSILMTICDFLLFRSSREMGAAAWLIRAFLTAGIAMVVSVKTFTAIP